MVDETENVDDYRLDDQVGYILRLASQRHAAIFQSMAPTGLTPTQFSTLMRLHEQGKCSQNRLGRLASMDVATIKGVVDRLHHKGLTLAESDPNDKRRTLISLSEKGIAMIPSLHQTGHAITAETLKPLSDSEQHTLLKLLRKLT